MADSNIPISAGSGTLVDTRIPTGGDHRQVVVLGDPNTVANVAGVTSDGGLLVASTMPAMVTGTPITGSAQTSATVSTVGYDGLTLVVSGTHAGVNLTIEGTLDGTNWVGITGFAPGANTVLTAGVTGVITTNATVGYEFPVHAFRQVRVRSTAWTSGSMVVQIQVSATSGAVTTAGGIINVNNLLTNNMTQVGGTAIATGSGVNGAGALRVSLATDQAALSVAGVLSAKVDQTTIGVTNGVALVAASGNAVNCLTFINGALTVANVKASTGNVFGMSIANLTASPVYIQFYNTAGTPTLGTSVIWFIAVPASGTVTMAPGGLAMANFSTGIGIGASTTPTSTGTPATAPAVTIFYK